MVLGKSTKYAIAYDPGRSTGECLISITNVQQFDVIRSRVIPWDQRFHYYDDLFPIRAYIVAIVVESFRLYDNPILMKSQINSDFPSVRIIGAIEQAAYRLDLLDKLYFQSASERKNVQIDQEHKAKLVRSQHAYDAYMHARFWFKLNRRKLKWD